MLEPTWLAIIWFAKKEKQPRDSKFAIAFSIASAHKVYPFSLSKARASATAKRPGFGNEHHFSSNMNKHVCSDLIVTSICTTWKRSKQQRNDELFVALMICPSSNSEKKRQKSRRLLLWSSPIQTVATKKTQTTYRTSGLLQEMTTI